jgi:hypothetical protein
MRLFLFGVLLVFLAGCETSRPLEKTFSSQAAAVAALQKLKITVQTSPVFLERKLGGRAYANSERDRHDLELLQLYALENVTEFPGTWDYSVIQRVSGLALWSCGPDKNGNRTAVGVFWLKERAPKIVAVTLVSLGNRY